MRAGPSLLAGLWRAAAVAVLVVVGLVALVVPPADATSCDGGVPASGDLWDEATTVFSAELSTPDGAAAAPRGRASAPLGAHVLEVFKGEVEADVVLRVDACSSAQIATAPAVVAARRVGDTLHYLGQMSVEQARTLMGTAPVADGVGPVQAVVSLDAGAIDVVALDDRGRALGFHPGTGAPQALAMCPGGRTFVSFTGEVQNRRIEVVDTVTMTTIRTMAWSPSTARPYLGCPSADGARVVTYATGGDDYGYVETLGDDATPQQHAALRSAFGLDAAGNVVGWSNVFKSEVVTVDPRTGQAVTKRSMPTGLHGITTAAPNLQVSDDPDFAAVSPDGRWLALVASESGLIWPPPAFLVLYDLDRTMEPRSVRLDGEGTPRHIDWVGGTVSVAWEQTPTTGPQGTPSLDPTHLRRQIVHPDGASEPPLPWGTGTRDPATAVTTWAWSGADAANPTQAAVLHGVPASMLGSPIAATAFVPPGTGPVLSPAAAQPVLEGRPAPNGGRPSATTRGAVAVWCVAIVVLAIVGLKLVRSLRRRSNLRRNEIERRTALSAAPKEPVSI